MGNGERAASEWSWAEGEHMTWPDLIWQWLARRKVLKYPCPACGQIGATLQFDPQAKKVNRVCVTCGCTVQQPPVLPQLFGSQ